MKNFLKILVLPIAVVTMLGSFAPKVFAVDPMAVTFDPDPIFGEVINFLPGDVKEGDAIVTNNTDSLQNVYAESVNGFDPDGLGSQLYLKVSEDGNPIPVYQDEVDDFLSTGPVPLSSLDGGTTKTYTFEVSFINSEDNNYQGKSLGFDLCIGFSGGAFQCGDTVISPPSDPGGNSTNIPGGSDGSDGGGSGRGGQFVQLVIFNESVLDIDEANGTATIQWDTNLLATSQVIYGPISPGGPYFLDINNPLYLGYPLGTAENGTKVLHHTAVLTGLAGGQTYVYRVVSRASPPTVGQEHTFTMPTKSAGNIVIAQARPAGVASISEESEGAGETPDTEATSTGEIEAGAENNSNLLAFALGGLNFDLPGLICVGVALLIFLVFLGLLWLIYQKKKDRPLAGEIALLIVFGLVASGILWFIPYTCPIIPLWVIVTIYVIWRLVSRYFTRPN